MLSEKTIIFSFAISLFIIPSAFATCAPPTICSQTQWTCNSGFGIFPLGGRVYINGTLLPGNWTIYNFTIVNTNTDKSMEVILRPSPYMNDYVYGEKVDLPAGINQKVTLPAKVWIAGPDRAGQIYFDFHCNDGAVQYFTPTIVPVIYGKKMFEPPMTTCHSEGLDACYYTGLYRDYTCSGNNLVYSETCKEDCCKSVKGSNAFCFGNKCLNSTSFVITEGSIAFVCRDDKCAYGKEKNLIFWLKYNGWNVTGKGYKSWTEEQLNQFDIIACSDETKACKISFNSPIYNVHVEKNKPIIEFPSAGTAYLGYTFGYLSKQAGTYGYNPASLASQHEITQGLNQNFMPMSKNPLAGFDTKYFTPLTVQDLLDVVYKSKHGNLSSLFVVDDSVDHGRYAFVGWFAKYDTSSLSNTGELVLNRTLDWLKEGNDYTKTKKIGVVCLTDSCSAKTEIATIKWLRSNGYSVIGRGYKNWNETNLNNVEMITCIGSACNFKKDSALYNEHSVKGKGFLELSTSKIYAAYSFGYTNSTQSSLKSGVNISFVSGNIFSSEGISQIFEKKGSMYSISKKYLKVKDVADIPPTVSRYSSYSRSTPINYTTMFQYSSPDNKVRYMFVGWASNPGNLNDAGNQLLLKAVEWVRTGTVPS